MAAASDELAQMKDFFEKVKNADVGPSEDIFSGTSLADLSGFVSEKSLEQVRRAQYERLTKVQAWSVAQMCASSSVFISSFTGSGKTLAYVLPIFERLRLSRFKHQFGTGAMIVTPTRESSLQVHDLVEQFAKAHGRSHCVLVSAGFTGEERRQLEKGCVVVVGTPGRLLFHLRNTQRWEFGCCEVLVVDEVEHILNKGHGDTIDQIVRILNRPTVPDPTAPPKPNQVALVTVSLSPDIELFTKKFPHIHFKRFSISKRTRPPPSIVGKFCTSSLNYRLPTLAALLRSYLTHKKKVMVFMGTNALVRFYQLLLGGVFKLHGMQLRGEMDTKEKSRVFFKFRKSQSSSFLLCTDVAAFGLDVADLDVVIHFDVPHSATNYVEKTGRCGRAGMPGESVLMLQPCELPMLDYLRTEAGVQLSELRVPVNDAELDRVIAYVDKLDEAKNDALNLYEHVIVQYSSHPLKDVCNVGNLNFRHVALSLGLPERPDVFIRCSNLKDSRSKKRKLRIRPGADAHNAKVTKFESDDSDSDL